MMDVYDRWHPATKTLVAVALVVVIGYLDFVTGFEISFAFFYIVPVAVAAWSIGLEASLGVALLSASAWVLANRLAGDPLARSAVLYWNATTRLGFFVVIAVLLVRLRAALERERAISRTDHLTGVLNRRAFAESIRQELERARRYGRTFSVAYLDLDNFKAVNDRFGHSAGDALLRTVAELMQDVLRRTDTVARLGGDEFAIQLPETDMDAAAAAVANLRARIAAAMQARDWPVTVSVGVLTCRELPPDVDALIAQADALMYDVKRHGKDGIAARLYGEATG